MLKRPFFALSGYWLAGMLASTSLMASDETMDQAAQSVEAQQVQSELQQQIDRADEATREQLEELRQLEQETRQMSASNAALSSRLASEAERQQRLAQALDTLSDTRAALPVIEQDMAEQLTRWIESDLPFLRGERLARVEGVEVSSQESAERIAELLEAWRAELAYGRQVDSWRGRLQRDGGAPREVDYLRIGRIGLYYLTPDGREGGVWDQQRGEWLALEERARREVRNGLRIADDQRTPELLQLPLSITATGAPQ